MLDKIKLKTYKGRHINRDTQSQDNLFKIEMAMYVMVAVLAISGFFVSIRGLTITASAQKICAPRQSRCLKQCDVTKISKYMCGCGQKYARCIDAGWVWFQGKLMCDQRKKLCSRNCSAEEQHCQSMCVQASRKCVKEKDKQFYGKLEKE
ncbi:hypothetical protein ScPMuIL_016916 [Solemya velum]